MDYCAVTVPADITEAVGTKGPVLVMAKVNDSKPFQVSLFPVGGGRHCIRIKAKVRRETNTKTGDRIRLQVTVLDRANVVIPDALASALMAEGATVAFNALAPGKQNFIIRRIDAAAKPETRAMRIREAVVAAHEREQRMNDHGSTRRVVAFLKGVMPTNAKMPALRAAFESARFTNVKTILGSGNVAFDTSIQTESDIERLAEKAMKQTLGRSFYTIVRSSAYLQRLLASDPFTAAGIPHDAKRVISFMREARSPKVVLPLAENQASVFLALGREVFSAYVPTDQGPIFMGLIQRAFGTDVTTRTVETVLKCASA